MGRLCNFQTLFLCWERYGSGLRFVVVLLYKVVCFGEIYDSTRFSCVR